MSKTRKAFPSVWINDNKNAQCKIMNAPLFSIFLEGPFLYFLHYGIKLSPEV